MQTVIREYSKNDKKRCMEAFVSNVPLFFTEGEVMDFDRFLTKLEAKDKTERTKYYVVEVNGNVIGCGGFGDKEGAQMITFAWGLIHNDFHKKGFGKILLYHRLEQIELLFPNLPVVIDTTQHSFSFFEKYGFQTTKITEDFYAKGMHRYDMLLVKE